jgi:hypothetical protein
MEGRSFELSEDESSVDGGEENEDGHGDQLSALRREPSVTFPRGFSSKEDLEIGTPKLGGLMSSGGVFANADDATNDVGEEDLEDECARRRSMDEFRRPASISSLRRGGLSSAFSAIDLASSTEKPPRAPNAHRVSQEFEEEIDRLRDKFDVNDTSAFSPAFHFKTGEVINAGADSPPVAFYAYAQSPASTSSKHAASVSPRVREGTFLGSSPRSLGTSPGSFTRGGIMGRSGPKPLPTSSSPNFHEPLRREIGFDGAGFKNARERYFEQVTKFLSERFQHEDDYENTWISLRSKSEPSLFKLCKKPLTMGESYQEFFVDHADVFELSEDERHVRLIR